MTSKKNAKEKILITVDSKKKYESELERLINVDRQEVIQEIKDARGQGDLSENAEYDSAREKQGQIEARISEIEHILANAEVIKTKEGNIDKVTIGSFVTIKDLSVKNAEPERYHIVGKLDVNPLENKISDISPLAKTIMGRKVGDICEVEAPNKYKVEIIAIDK